MSEQQAREAQAGHEYIVVDGLGGPWLAEVSTEYPEPSPIGLIDDILATPSAVAEKDAEIERLRAENEVLVNSGSAAVQFWIEQHDQVAAKARRFPAPAEEEAEGSR